MQLFSFEYLEELRFVVKIGHFDCIDLDRLLLLLKGISHSDHLVFWAYWLLGLTARMRQSGVCYSIIS